MKMFLIFYSFLKWLKLNHMGNNFFPTQYFSSCGRILLNISPGLSLPTNSLQPK